MGGGIWYGRQAADEKDQDGMSCHSRHWPIITLAVELSSQQIKTLGVGVWVVLGKDKAVDRDRFLLCLRPSSFFVCSGLLISSSASSSPPLSLSESTVFPCPIVGTGQGIVLSRMSMLPYLV